MRDTALAAGDFDGNGSADLAIGMVPSGAADGVVDILPGGTDIDSDGDGLNDWKELNQYGTDVLDRDTDEDGISDGNEINGGAQGAAPLQAGAAQAVTDPLLADTDGDGILDGTEIGLVAAEGNATDPAVFVADLDPSTTTNPILADSDGDGLSDGAEDANRNGAVDGGETDAAHQDTDGDGWDDGTEVAAGSDPTDPGSTPVQLVPALPTSGLIALALLLGAGGALLARSRSWGGWNRGKGGTRCAEAPTNASRGPLAEGALGLRLRRRPTQDSVLGRPASLLGPEEPPDGTPEARDDRL